MLAFAIFLLAATPLSPTWQGEPYALPAEMDPTFAEGSPIEPDFWGVFDDDDEDDDHDADHDKEADDLDDDAPPSATVPNLSVLTGAACIRDLVKRGIAVKAAPARFGMENAVELTGKIGGVEWVNAWAPKRPMQIDCRFAYSLLRFAPLLTAHKVVRVTWTSTYRAPSGRRVISQHGHGLAVDVHSLILDDGRELVVLKDWRKAYGTKDDCVGKPATADGRLMRQLICATEKAGIFRLILTPDSDWDHQNHFHIDGLGPQEGMRHRHAGRAPEQPLPGEPAFENWWKWYSCYKKRTIQAQQRCRRNRTYLKPRTVNTAKTLSPSVQKPREPRHKPQVRRKPAPRHKPRR